MHPQTQHLSRPPPPSLRQSVDDREDEVAELVQRSAGAFIGIDEFTALRYGVQHCRHGGGQRQAWGVVQAWVPPPTTAALRMTRSRDRKCAMIDTSGCRYNVVRHVASKLGWEEARADSSPKVVWIDTSVSLERIARSPAHCIFNHFPGMLGICRKIEGARLLTKLKRRHPDAFPFVPDTFLTYDEYLRSSASFPSTPHHGRPPVQRTSWYIVKPDSGCMGKGIALTQHPTKAHFASSVVQSYIADPLLIEGCKWDMRVYALILSVDPLRVYVYKDGFIRLCTEKYEAPTQANSKNTLIHLTNYAIHKKSKKYVRASAAEGVEEGEGGCKRSFSFLFDFIEKAGGDAAQVWDGVTDLVVKTLLAGNDHLRSSYRAAFPEEMNTGTSCFEVLGFDVLIDTAFKPYLLEVNHAPSFTCDSPLDLSIKSGVVEEALQLLGLGEAGLEPSKMRAGQTLHQRAEALKRFWRRKAEYEDGVAERFVRVYPSPSDAKQAAYESLLFTIQQRGTGSYSSCPSFNYAVTRVFNPPGQPGGARMTPSIRRSHTALLSGRARRSHKPLFGNLT